MAQIQDNTSTRVALRIVFDSAVVLVPLGAATTFGEIARAVRGMSARRQSHAAAIAVMFDDDRPAERSAPPEISHWLALN